MTKLSKNARICIVGAGAAGLSTAYFLKKQGYRNVLVLEKAGRVGGLCCSITYNSRSFDLGANYLTPAYKEVLKMAEEVGAPLYSEGPGQVYNPFKSQPGQPAYTSIMKAVTEGTDRVTFLAAVGRFWWERLWLEPIISVPGFASISQHPELTQPFSQWLAQKDLSCLATLFEIPITAMGYGYLNEIPTVYALKYMTLETFGTLVTYGADMRCGWPKRFIDGFQRFWERVAWGINVRLNIDIKEIKRGAITRVRFTEQEQILDKIVTHEEVLEFDYLVLACPLTLNVLNTFLDLSPAEKDLFEQIILNPYSLITYLIPDLEMPTPVTNVIPLNAMGNPWFIAQQFADNDLIAFYTRLDREGKITKTDVLQGIQKTLKNLGVQVDDDYYTYDKWPYFPHVTSEVMQAGFYDRLEAMQGQRKTFYVGGLLNFELVETIVEYSKSLVEKNF
ncbi:FAD-dependent oxidoreductase [Nostoc sp. ChiSLP03a]|uniref:FAD-dependent oxidoreductase n=1 Tax=Nostoc sp. ChiSLP03a TaxID=3075380 RepID=UPI002AD32C89|nr:FAD-dependent oxidoreductase [Nostoc sp. ChiSLP03a]MDZ8213892.1 FAD-dependent oxidoreductase [Nostoc sp. ChiSLP03a]